MARQFRTMPPSLQELEWRNAAKSLPLDELRLLAGVIQYELDEREGRQKYQIPAHVQAMLN
jgi:hypothetical protein